VNYVLAVNVLQCQRHLVDVVARPFLSVPLQWLGLHIFIQISTRHILQYKVNLLFVVEKPVHGQYVLMSQVRTDLNLPLDLPFKATFNELRLVKVFQSDYKFALPLPRKVNLPCFTTAKRLANFEVVDCPFLGVESLCRSSWSVGLKLLGELQISLISLIRTNF